MPPRLQPGLLDGLRGTARLYRLGMDAAAAKEMQKVTEDLVQLTSDPVLEAQLGPVVGQWLAAQERGDVICVADFLEHVILPELQALAEG